MDYMTANLKYLKAGDGSINESIQSFNDNILYGILVVRNSHLYIQE